MVNDPKLGLTIGYKLIMMYSRVLLVFIVLAVFPGYVIAQSRSLSDLSADEIYTSESGKFTIALPGNPTTNTPFKKPTEAGGEIGWRLKEGVITIRYAESSDPNFVFTKKDHYKSFFVGLRVGIMGSLRAKTSSEDFIKLGEHRGYEFKFETDSKLRGQVRIFVVGKRYYTMTGYASSEIASAEMLITKAFDSFKISEPTPPGT